MFGFKADISFLPPKKTTQLFQVTYHKNILPLSPFWAEQDIFILHIGGQGPAGHYSQL